jgi:HK97 family phage major capsid protein
MIELVAHKLAGYSLASNEVRADAAASVEALLTTMFGRAIGSKENYAFFRGDGVGKPLGILESGALISATRATASKVALDDIGEMVGDLLPSSWGKGAWFINPAVVQQLIGLVSSPLAWMNDLRSGMPVQLLGMPLYVTGALPGLNTAGDILLVDPSYYLIGDRQQISIAYSEHYAFVTDQAAWRFTYRVDGQPWLNNEITLEDAATQVSPYVALAAG